MPMHRLVLRGVLSFYLILGKKDELDQLHIRKWKLPVNSRSHMLLCPSSQDRDFCLLHPEDPLFQTFSGETLRYKGKEPLYPFFINECAYYEKGIALSLARKRRVMIPAIRVQTEQEEQSNEQRFTSEEEEWGWSWRDEISDCEIN